MKTYAYNTPYGNICYEEPFFSNKRRIFINNQELERVNKVEYIYHTPEQDISVKLKGNVLFGAKLFFNNDFTNGIQVAQKNKWYEIVIVAFIFIFSLVWGNSRTLVSIIPLVGGAIGGFISAITSVLTLFYMKYVTKPLYKVLIGLAGFVINFLLLLSVGLIVSLIIAAASK